MKNQKIKTVLIAAGGTGGHVFPGIAVARELQKRGVDVAWLGTLHGLDTHLVPDANIPYYQIHIKGLRGKSKLSLLLAPFNILRGIWQAMRVIMRTKADVVIGMGGYVSGPAGIAAWLLRKPLYIHEQNALAGMTNRQLARFTKRVFSAFPNAFPASIKVQVTGNPVRQDITHLPAPVERYKNHSGPLRLLVLGGSQGAVVVNRLIPQIREYFSVNKVAIWHQTGAKNFEQTQKNYIQTGAIFDETLRINPFIDDMPTAYSWADIVICRAGALTVSELAAVGVASILIPFPYAVDDHQTHNAQFLQHAGAAEIIQERDVTAAKLITLLEEFSTHRDRLMAMATAARNLAKPDATALVVDEILR